MAEPQVSRWSVNGHSKLHYSLFSGMCAQVCIVLRSSVVSLLHHCWWEDDDQVHVELSTFVCVCVCPTGMLIIIWLTAKLKLDHISEVTFNKYTWFEGQMHYYTLYLILLWLIMHWTVFFPHHNIAVEFVILKPGRDFVSLGFFLWVGKYQFWFMIQICGWHYLFFVCLFFLLSLLSYSFRRHD